MLTTARRAISYPNPDRSDRPDIPAHLQILANALDVDTLYNQGTDAARAAAAHQASGGRFWWTTDTLSLWYDDGTTWRQVFGQPAVPPGVLAPFAGAAAPSGWLLCDGSPVSRTTYNNLFAAIATAYGVGDGSTTFNIPDMRGRVPVGKNTATFASLGASAGAETVTLDATMIPSHTHVFTGAAMGSHGHTFSGNDMGTHGHSFSGNTMPNHGHASVSYVNTLVRISSDFQKGGTGGGITDFGGALGSSAGVNYGMFTSNDSAGVPTGAISNASVGTPTGTVVAASAGTPSGTNANTGGGLSHSNLMPYLVTNYIIKT